MAVNSETLGSIVAASRDLLNEPGNTFISDTEIKRWVNQGMLYAVNSLENLEKEETISVVSGTASYALPEDHQNTIDVQYQSNGHNRYLVYIEPREYRAVTKVQTTSMPTSYTVYGNKLYVYKTPSGTSGTLSHRYTAVPQELVDDIDVPYNGVSMLYPYHLDLVSYVAYHGEAKKGNLDTSLYYKKIFEENVRIMIKSLSARRKGGGQFQRQYTRGKRAYPVLPSNY